jgi:hypothetical protein
LPGCEQIYVKSVSGAGCCLAQGEIISNLVHTYLDVSSLGKSEIRIVEQIHPLSIILSQGCELEQDYRSRSGEKIGADKRIPCVLFCEVIHASDFRGMSSSTQMLNRMSQNNDERYHFFQSIATEVDAEGEGLPELGVDFKRLFAIRTDELYWRLDAREARRRCALQSPYLEHFCRRFANFLSRVALPEPHSSH